MASASESEDGEVHTLSETTISLHSKLSMGRVKTLLENNTLKAAKKSKTAKSSKAWDSFLQVVDESGKSIGYAQCKSCKYLYRCGTGIGTKTLKHICGGTSETVGNSATISKFISQRRIVTETDKKTMTDALVYYCAKDLRPFECVKGMGFRKMISTVLRLGARVGEASVDELLADPTTISRNLGVKAKKLFDELKIEVGKVFSTYGGGITTDFWMDDYQKLSYYAITAHYWTIDWKPKTVLLGIFECDSAQRKTGDNIRPILEKKLHEFGIDESSLKKVIFVTDQGSNLIKALRRESRISCSAHVLNTVRKTVLSDDPEETRHKEATACIDACKALVKFFNQSCLKNRLKKMLHQYCDTRWYSKVDMLTSVLESWDEVEMVLEEREETDMLMTINKLVVESLVSLLTPFKTAILALERTDRPTLPFVWLHYLNLKQHLYMEIKIDQYNELHCIREVRKHLLDVLEEKLVIMDEHKVATFLHPSYKEMSFENLVELVPLFEKLAIHSKVRQLTSKIFVDPPADCSISSSPSTPRATHASSVSQKCHVMVDDQFLDEFGPKRIRAAIGDVSDEVTLYLDEESERIGTTDLSGWWKSKSEKYPRLSALARKYLAVPATSASSESVFSSAGRTVTDLRSRLTPETVSNIIFIHYNG